jgi:hypothetical protein
MKHLGGCQQERSQRRGRPGACIIAFRNLS